MIAGAAARLAEGTLPHLPSILEVPMATVGGTLAYGASSRARGAVRENLAIVAPERRDRERLVRQTFVEQVRHYIEIFRLARLDHEKVRQAVVTAGWDRFVAAVARGNGVIVASAHVGPVSVCGQIIAANGYDITLPIEKETGELGRSINRARTRMGLRFVETDSALGIHRVLKRGGILGVMADRAVTGVGERVPFFGHPALLPSAHVALAPHRSRADARVRASRWEHPARGVRARARAATHRRPRGGRARGRATLGRGARAAHPCRPGAMVGVRSGLAAMRSLGYGRRRG